MAAYTIWPLMVLYAICPFPLEVVPLGLKPALSGVVSGTAVHYEAVRNSAHHGHPLCLVKLAGTCLEEGCYSTAMHRSVHAHCRLKLKATRVVVVATTSLVTVRNVLVRHVCSWQVDFCDEARV
eukprot:1463744-Amphidinium_carterae.1